MKRKIISKFLLLSLSAGLLLTSCDDPPYRVELLTYDPAADEMVYKVKTVETLDDIDRLEGRATQIKGGVSIVLDYANEEVRWERVGTPVAFNAIKVDGVHYPSDFDSLAMISVYYNIERAMLFFESIGMPPGLQGPLETFYWAEVIEKTDFFGDDPEESADNAFYLSISETDRGFYILPFDHKSGVINGIPLSMNPGVIAHEYAHSVFQELIYDKLPAYGAAMDITNYNYLWCLNEGIADIFAVALTGDPDFISASIRHWGVTRNAADVIIYKASFDRNVLSASAMDLDPYEIGSFISATVFEITRRLDGLPANGAGVPSVSSRRIMARKTYNVIHNLGEMGAEYFEVPDFFSYLLDQFGPDGVRMVCDVLQERFALHYNDVIGCPEL